MTKRSVTISIAALSLMFVCSAFADENPPPAKPGAPKQVQPPQPIQVDPAERLGLKPDAPKPVDPNAPQPKMVVEKIEYDAGVVSKGQVVDALFTVKNEGKGMLTIERVQPACGCTVPTFDREIEPGKSGTIKASVNTQGFSGPIAKTVQVFTNDANTQTFTLTIKADVKAILNVLVTQKQPDGTETLTPRDTEQIGLVFKGVAAEREFLIRSEDAASFQITQVQTEDTHVRYELIPAKDKLSTRFKVSVPATYPAGPVQARFVLTTTHPKVPTLNVNVFGTIREPLTVYPKEIVFNGLALDYIQQNPEDPALNKLITVAFETGPELKVSSVASDASFLETSVEATAENQRYSVKVHLNPAKAKAGEFTASVTITTNKQKIVIPVRGRIF